MPQHDPYSSTDVLDPLYREIRELKRRVDSLENLSIPTMPKYDPNDFPQDSVEGQVALGIDNTVWIFTNGQWWSAWVNLTLLSPWTAVGGSYHPPQYSRNLQGEPRLRGAATGGSAGQPMGVLPIDFRRPKDQKYVIAKGTTTSVLLIESNGTITPLS